MRNQNVFDMVIMSMFLTIIIIMSSVPNLGYISLPFFPGVGGTIVHIPVLVACIYFGYRVGIVAGLFFGISSWIVALTRAVLPFEILFTNPLISVVPRILFAILAVFIYKLLSKYIKNDTLNITLTSVLSTLVHTALVLPMLSIFGYNIIGKTYGEASISSVFAFVKYVLVFNTVLETIAAGLIVTPIILALKSYTKKTHELNI